MTAGCGPFTYEKKGKGGSAARTVALKSYYEVPLDVLEKRSELVRWAREAAAGWMSCPWENVYPKGFGDQQVQGYHGRQYFGVSLTDNQIFPDDKVFLLG